ncbi:MAG TPA: urease accessory UreF family protein [Polyangiaceae bacterium]|nr:urease accessory UreF family protein [Polyangiaceae bacterium]
MNELSTPGLLRLLQIASPALPIGAFAYSQGLETALELGFVRDEASASEFLGGVLAHGLAELELPLLGRLWTTFVEDDAAAAERWSLFLLASRETNERRAEEQQLGRALARLLADQGIVEAGPWFRSPAVTHVGMFALAGARFTVPVAALVPAFAFAWAENQVGALARLLPLGQLAAQRVLAALGAQVPAAAAHAAALSDADVGATLPGLALASALHETQYTRLFKS